MSRGQPNKDVTECHQARPNRRAGAPEHMNYATWRAQAAAELEHLHGIAANHIPERIWKQLYVQNSSPREAAYRAQVHVQVHVTQ